MSYCWGWGRVLSRRRQSRCLDPHWPKALDGQPCPQYLCPTCWDNMIRSWRPHGWTPWVEIYGFPNSSWRGLVPWAWRSCGVPRCRMPSSLTIIIVKKSRINPIAINWIRCLPGPSAPAFPCASIPLVPSPPFPSFPGSVVPSFGSSLARISFPQGLYILSFRTSIITLHLPWSTLRTPSPHSLAKNIRRPCQCWGGLFIPLWRKVWGLVDSSLYTRTQNNICRRLGQRTKFHSPL